MISRILVAVDGSEGSRKAAGFAVELARSSNARLLLLTVLEQPWVVPFGPMDSFVIGPKEDQDRVVAARKQLDEFSAALPAEQVEKHVEVGEPADVIVEQADKLSADMIVMGARGHSAVSRWLLGSVSDRVVHHARKPVTVVR
jgi:nucleotide-binding universal stress UspA family protein